MASPRSESVENTIAVFRRVARRRCPMPGAFQVKEWRGEDRVEASDGAQAIRRALVRCLRRLKLVLVAGNIVAGLSIAWMIYRDTRRRRAKQKDQEKARTAVHAAKTAHRAQQIRNRGDKGPG